MRNGSHLHNNRGNIFHSFYPRAVSGRATESPTTMRLPFRYIAALVFGMPIVLMTVLQMQMVKDVSLGSVSGMEGQQQQLMNLWSEIAGFRQQLNQQQLQRLEGHEQQFMNLRSEIAGFRKHLEDQQYKQERLEEQIQQLMNLRSEIAGLLEEQQQQQRQQQEQVSENTTDEVPVVRNAHAEQHRNQSNNTTIKNAVNPFPIDFVIPAFPKCGTSFLLDTLTLTKGVYVPKDEVYNLRQNRVDELYKEFEGAKHENSDNNRKPLILGFKSPEDLKNLNAMNNLATLYSDIRMIIQLRHPVLQFESMYNHLLRTGGAPLLPVEDLVGVCNELCMPRFGPGGIPNAPTKGGRFADVNCKGRFLPLCTGQSSFHYYLSRLGLTPMDTRDELSLLDLHIMKIHEFSGWQRRKGEVIRGSLFSPTSTNGRLFLMEMGQIKDTSSNRTDALFSDLEDFLGLERRVIPRSRDGREQHSYTNETQKTRLKICRDEHKPVRDALLKDAQKSSKWILKYLLHPSNGGVVVVSNIDDFKRMVQGWTTDPCSKNLAK